MSDARGTIVELLRSIGGRKEVEQYLRHYCGAGSQKFAVIRIDGTILQERREEVAAALSFLNEVGLCPLVVHDIGPAPQPSTPGDASKQRALAQLYQRFEHESLQLVDALAGQHCQAHPIAGGALTANSDPSGKLVAELNDIGAEAMRSAIARGQPPIVTSLAQGDSGELREIDGDEAAWAVARALGPHKLIFLTPHGGFFDDAERLIPAINLSEERPGGSSQVAPRHRARLSRMRSEMQALPPSFSVSLTAPQHLARELFTHRGAGTLVRLGERVRTYERFEDVDRARLRGLLESCFERRLAPDYFEQRACHRVYVSDGYRATAIVTHEGGIAYLDKFAVTRKAQGEGLGGSIWRQVRREHRRLFWRAQSNNAVNNWYFQQADGSYREGPWTVFWCGLSGFAEIERCVKLALALPATLRAHGTEHA